uniref:Uncharacterized protein n=1 Tax=Meloidogyne incognita TaxID=6306 RepID=A0A914N6G7_MELIC
MLAEIKFSSKECGRFFCCAIQRLFEGSCEFERIFVFTETFSFSFIFEFANILVEGKIVVNCDLIVAEFRLVEGHKFEAKETEALLEA